MPVRSALAGLTTGIAVLVSLLMVPAAWAGADEVQGQGAAVTESGAGTSAGPVALAHTGLDITVPILVGLSILIAGTALIAWAVLRGSRGSHGTARG